MLCEEFYPQELKKYKAPNICYKCFNLGLKIEILVLYTSISDY